MRFLVSLFSVTLLVQISAAQSRESVIISASNKYEDPSIFRQILIGKNYRETWALPVSMPVFYISKEKGGLKIKELGGGFQTKSLKMTDKDGVEWVLRTVDKEVDKTLPPALRKTFVKKVVQDMISGSHPYGALMVAPLAKALKVNAPDPELFYVPDDPALGEFRSVFAHSVCMLERAEPTLDNSDTKSTETLFEKIKEENDHLVDDTTLLKARLLDMLVADWDRHKDQWKWGIRKEDGESFYYPIARDRDQAFFNSSGILVKVVRLFAMKQLVGFTKSDRKLKILNKKAWSFDKSLLNELDGNVWREIISRFQVTMNDELLESAVKNLPAEVYSKDGPIILETLKERRNGLMEYGMQYYAFLSNDVKVTGSDKEEIVKISNEGNDLKVTVQDKKSDEVRYERNFKSDQTREIQFDLLAGDDVFIIDKNVSSPIKLSLKGGKGRDKIQVESRLKIAADQETRNEMKEMSRAFYLTDVTALREP